MKSVVRMMLTGLLCLSMLGWANGPKSAKSMGANWAQLSDEAQIQLELDRLFLMDDNQNTTAKSSNNLIKDINRFDIHVDNDLATVVLADGSTIALRKADQRWEITAIEAGHNTTSVKHNSNSGAIIASAKQGFSAGQTFTRSQMSEEHGLDDLSRDVTETYFDRALFAAPENTVSYYHARYTDTAPFVEATYVQLVIDREWHRILYGSLDRWIKVYDNVKNPTSIAVDAAGRVFVGEAGLERITVLQIIPGEADTELTFLFAIDDVKSANGLALNDNGTPLDISDDHLYVADASRDLVIKYALDATSATKVAQFKRFDNPTVILSGRWNGANTNQLYVVDDLNRRIQLFEDIDNSLTLINAIQGDYQQYFSTVKADHFGNVYVVDRHTATLSKYTADLQFLDSEASVDTKQGLNSIDIPFGKIIVEGEGTYWAGFDQLFTLERWTDESGAKRHTLGLSLQDVTFSADADVSEIVSNFKLTDAGDVSVQVYNERNDLVRDLTDAWMLAGSRNQVWDRRDDDAKQVAPGNYRIEISAQSAYSDAKTVLGGEFYLPAYFWQNAGSDIDNDFLLQGKPVYWGASATESAVQHDDAVVYRFSGLNPASEYKIAMEFFSGDQQARTQKISVDGEVIHEGVAVSAKAVQTEYLTIPQAAIEDGQVRIAVEDIEGNSAVVSQVWLKETGVSFQPQQAASDKLIPADFELAQNFPNPFNPTTTIQYRLPADATVTLDIYNNLGQKVRTLVDDFRSAGTHSVVWDGRNAAGSQVASGIYFYRVNAGTFSATRRMLLLK